MSAMTLLPCPFCGGDKAALVRVANIGHAVSCNGCGASSEVGPSADLAIAKWNARSNLTQAAQSVDAVPVTANALADAFEIFWNAALDATHQHQDVTANAVMAGMVEGFAAMAGSLREPAAAALTEKGNG